MIVVNPNALAMDFFLAAVNATCCDDPAYQDFKPPDEMLDLAHHYLMPFVPTDRVLKIACAHGTFQCWRAQDVEGHTYIGYHNVSKDFRYYPPTVDAA